MKIRSLATLLLLTSPVMAIESRTYICTRDNAERTIELHYPTGQSLPCEVNYTKSGNTQTLWQAFNQTGYCEEKAEAFVEKHRQWGWHCTTALNDSVAGIE